MQGKVSYCMFYSVTSTHSQCHLTLSGVCHTAPAGQTLSPSGRVPARERPARPRQDGVAGGLWALTPR